jgi:hypothetical protein
MAILDGKIYADSGYDHCDHFSDLRDLQRADCTHD